MDVDYCFVESNQFPPAGVSNDPTRPLCFLPRHVCRSFPAVVAHQQGLLLGWLSFTLQPGRVLLVHVLWVDQAVRGAGVAATLLWLLVRCMRPKALNVEVISDDGERFFRRSRRHYPKVRFRVYGAHVLRETRFLRHLSNVLRAA